MSKPLFPILVKALKEYDEKLPMIKDCWDRVENDKDISHYQVIEELAIRQVRDAFFKEQHNPNSRDKLDCVGITTFRRFAEIMKIPEHNDM